MLLHLSDEQASTIVNREPGRYRLSIICGANFAKLVAARVAVARATTPAPEGFALLLHGAATSLTEGAFTVEEIGHPAFRVRCPDCKRKHALVLTRAALEGFEHGRYFRTEDYAILLSLVGWEDDQLRAVLPQRDVSRRPKWRGETG